MKVLASVYKAKSGLTADFYQPETGKGAGRIS
jgi:hypothetical protein